MHRCVSELFFFEYISMFFPPTFFFSFGKIDEAIIRRRRMISFVTEKKKIWWWPFGSAEWIYIYGGHEQQDDRDRSSTKNFIYRPIYPPRRSVYVNTTQSPIEFSIYYIPHLYKNTRRGLFLITPAPLLMFWSATLTTVQPAISICL